MELNLCLDIPEKKEELGTEYTDMANYALESFLEQKDDIADIKGEDVKAHIDFFFEMADKVCEDTCRSEYVPYLEGISNGFSKFDYINIQSDLYYPRNLIIRGFSDQNLVCPTYMK